MRRLRAVGSMALVGSAFLWASAYIFVKQLVADFPPMLLLALRFSEACILLYVILLAAGQVKKAFRKKNMVEKSETIPDSFPEGHLCREEREGSFRLGMTVPVFRAGIQMGVALFFEFMFFTVGIKYTSASKSSFLIASYIILLPIAYYLIRRKKPSGGDVLSAVVCMAGICVLLLNGFETFNKGDFLSLLCAAAYAVHVVLSADYAKKYDGALLNLVQIGSAAVLSWLGWFAECIFGRVTGSGDTTGFSLEGMVIPGGAILYLALVCTILPYFMSLFGMKYVSATASGILLSFESVFAAAMAVFLLGEPFYWQLGVGGALIVASFFLSEICASKVSTA